MKTKTTDKKDFSQACSITAVTKIKKDKTWVEQVPIIQEVPLQIRLNHTPWLTLMRTPGFEKELALGLSFTEGMLPEKWAKDDLCWEEFDPQQNTIGFSLDYPGWSEWPNQNGLSQTPGLENEILGHDFPHLLRPGLKGIDNKLIDNKFKVHIQLIQGLESQIRDQQFLFRLTGATHAACIFDSEGNYLFCGEDLARHNALDKAIGYALLHEIGFDDKILVLSGRTNHTLIRKAALAGFSIVASVSAPTSLAVNLSKSLGITLIGFLRSQEMNIYTKAERIIGCV